MYILQILFFVSFFRFSDLFFEEKSYSHVDHRGIPFDQKLLELMNYEKGFFVEVGANDGINQSNTKRFEEFHNWKGILIEPSEELFPTLCANRPHSTCFCCALGSFEENGSYVEGDFNGDLMSSVNGKRLGRSNSQKVKMRSLQSILDEIGIQHVDFFSLDTEGYELNILRGIDFDKTTFDYILIEIYNEEYEAIVSLLKDKGYRLVENFSNYNFIDNPSWEGTHNDYLFKRKKRWF